MQYLEPQPQPTELEFKYKKHRSRERPMKSRGSLPCKKGESQQHPAVQNQRLRKINTWFSLFYSLSTLTKKGLSKAYALMFRNIRILWKAGSFSYLQCDHHTKSYFRVSAFCPVLHSIQERTHKKHIHQTLITKGLSLPWLCLHYSSDA